jgi:hypothetical protein
MTAANQHLVMCAYGCISISYSHLMALHAVFGVVTHCLLPTINVPALEGWTAWLPVPANEIETKRSDTWSVKPEACNLTHSTTLSGSFCSKLQGCSFQKFAFHMHSASCSISDGQIMQADLVALKFYFLSM